MPFSNASTTYASRQSSAMRRTASRLKFKEITLSDLPAINALLQQAGSRTCDYSLGGLYMWIDYFHYQYCIYRDTLFIKGVVENHTTVPAFSLPIGRLSLEESVGILEEYCRAQGFRLCFSAIPADRVDEFLEVGRWDIEEMTDWADYLYDIEALATLSGKKLNKKRNHVNRFLADNPGASLTPLTVEGVDEVKDAYDEWLDCSEEKDSPTATEERRMTFAVLDNLSSYPFEGAVLRDGRGKIVAFTLAEVIGDTMFVHIEKMDHRVAGAGESINKMFAEMMMSRHRDLRYANREEDVGDPGLRRAKQSYHPARLLSKYNLSQN